MTAVATDAFMLTEIVGDLDIPCDYSDERDCPDLPAEWVLHVKACCYVGRQRLACDTCKENRLMDAFSLECATCGHIFERAPDAYVLIEALNRRGT